MSAAFRRRYFVAGSPRASGGREAAIVKGRVGSIPTSEAIAGSAESSSL